ncbi:MAG: hypothetical protein AB7F59_07465 [Bdellovibrionales bacterium]
MRSNREKWLTFLVPAGIFVFGLYAITVFLFFKYPDEIFPIPPHFDTRTNWQVLAELRRNNTPSSMALVPKDVVHDKTKKHNLIPLSGESQVYTVFCNESGEFANYTSDSKGFNNLVDRWNDKEIDVVLLGDSFTHGACVPTPETFGGVFESLGKKTISLGMWGNGPYSMLGGIREYIPHIRTKVVLWNYVENDINDMNTWESWSDILKKYYEDDQFSQHLYRDNDKKDRFAKSFTEDIYKKKEPELLQALDAPRYIETPKDKVLFNLRRISTLYDLRFHIKRVIAHFKEKKNYQDSNTPPPDLFRQILLKAKAEVEKQGAEFYFVYLPGWPTYALQAPANYQNRAEILKLVQSLQIPIIDLHKEVFAQHPDPLSLFPLRINNHYNAEGYRLAVQAMDRFLKTHSKKYSPAEAK